MFKTNDTNINAEPDEQAYSNFGLIAALVTCGFDVRRTSKDGARIVFIFTDSKALEDTVNDYWSGKLLVSARQYSEATKTLKSRIYGG